MREGPAMDGNPKEDPRGRSSPGKGGGTLRGRLGWQAGGKKGSRKDQTKGEIPNGHFNKKKKTLNKHKRRGGKKKRKKERGEKKGGTLQNQKGGKTQPEGVRGNICGKKKEFFKRNERGVHLFRGGGQQWKRKVIWPPALEERKERILKKTFRSTPNKGVQRASRLGGKGEVRE